MKKPKRKSKLKLRFNATQVIEYMVSGGVYFWAGYAVFFVADSIIGLDLFWAKLLANLVGWILNYLLQRFWVFRNPGKQHHRPDVTFRYAVITLTNFVLDYAIVWALNEAGLTPYIGQFISAGFFTVWNYLWYRLWVFTNRTHHGHPKKALKRGRS
jgi:putative flippase GtrA